MLSDARDARDAEDTLGMMLGARLYVCTDCTYSTEHGVQCTEHFDQKTNDIHVMYPHPRYLFHRCVLSRSSETPDRNPVISGDGDSSEPTRNRIDDSRFGKNLSVGVQQQSCPGHELQAGRP